MSLSHCYLVDLREANYSELVKVVPQLSSVRAARFRGASLNPEQIKSITSCPHIDRLYLDKKRYPSEEIMRCYRYEPKVAFEIYE